MTILGLLLFIIPGFIGSSLTNRYNIARDTVTNLLIGTIVGLVSVTTGFYILAAVIKITPLVIWITLTILGFIALLTVQPRLQLSVLNFNLWDRANTTVLILTLVLALLLAPKLLFFDGTALSTNVLNAWGDLGWHVANITGFAEGQAVPPQDPIYAGSKLFYPFLINFFSGLLVIAGATIAESVTTPVLILLPIFFTLFFIFARTITGNTTAAAIAILLLIFSGSTLGWTQLTSDLANSARPVLDFFLHLPRDYAGTGSGGELPGWQFLNIIIAGLLPQRSLLFGLPLAMSLLIILLTALETFEKKSLVPFVLAGVVAGLMPLAHAHTVLVMIPTILFLALVHIFSERNHRSQAVAAWLVFAGVSVIVGFQEVLYFINGVAGTSGQFFRFAPGWTAQENWLWFWFKNAGLLIPVSLLSILIPGSRSLKAITAAGLLVFTGANLFIFAPWAWDNYKLLIWWLILTLPSIGWLLNKLLSYNRLLLSTLVILFMIIHMQTGFLDLFRTALPSAQAYEEWNSEAINIARQIQELTETNAVILTAPYHNSPVALSGRIQYMGFPGHVWSHGLPYFTREQAIKDFYEGRREDLPEIEPGFVVIGPVERQQFPQLVIQPNWQLVAVNSSYQLYRVQ